MAEPIAELERARLSADRQYNDTLSALDRAVVEVSSQQSLGRDDLARLTTALIVFLQQITAFVETKDRELDARLTQRIETLTPAIASLSELRTHLTVLQRTTQLVTHALASSPPPGLATSSPSGGPADPRARVSLEDIAYVGFEDEFRGSEQNIEARLREYLPLFAGADTVVDLGCGR